MTLQTSPPPSKVADKIRGIAVEKRIRQADMAEVLKVSRMAIVRRLNGTVPFTDRELKALSDYMNVPVGAFFGEVAS